MSSVFAIIRSVDRNGNLSLPIFSMMNWVSKNIKHILYTVNESAYF